jgi:hypothetical protein
MLLKSLQVPKNEVFNPTLSQVGKNAHRCRTRVQGDRAGTSGRGSATAWKESVGIGGSRSPPGLCSHGRGLPTLSFAALLHPAVESSSSNLPHHISKIFSQSARPRLPPRTRLGLGCGWKEEEDGWLKEVGRKMTLTWGGYRMIIWVDRGVCEGWEWLLMG